MRLRESGKARARQRKPDKVKAKMVKTGPWIRRGLVRTGIFMVWVFCVSGCGNPGVEEEAQKDAVAYMDSVSMQETDITENNPDENNSEEGVPERQDSEYGDIAGPGATGTDTGNGRLGETLVDGEHSVSESSVQTGGAAGLLSVKGTKLADGEGNSVQLRGISTHGLSWYPQYVNEACFRQLKEEWGVNVIRLAMYTAESGGYCTDGDRESLKSLVRQGVEYAVNNDMYVIIDWHILSDGNPNRYLEEALEFFGEMSEMYADYTNVLYEICNEPNGTVSWSEIKAYAEQVIEVIREKDEKGIILVGTPNWSQYVDQAAADPISGYDNIMYTLHFYAATHTDSLRETMIRAVESGLPVFVSEYGICDASGNGAIDEEQADKWIDIMDSYGISYVAWNLSNKAETSAILKSSCDKVSGFTEEDLSDSGRWLYRMLGGSSGSLFSKDASTEKPVAEKVQTSEKPEENRQTFEESSESGQESEKQTESRQAYGNLEITAEVVNSWEQGGAAFYQYTLTLTNSMEEAQNGWTICLEFNEDIVLMDGWNGSYQAEGSLLTISSLDYNSYIGGGENVKDVGFIVQGGQGLKPGE